jgi:hypothetical protein
MEGRTEKWQGGWMDDSMNESINKSRDGWTRHKVIKVLNDAIVVL